MPLNLCEPCCNPSDAARDKDSFQQAELVILCAILDAIQSGGGGGTPAAPFNSVQFNNAGAFGGSSNLLWDGAILSVDAAVQTFNVYLNEGAVDPTTPVNVGSLYTKDVAGVTQLFYRADSDGTVYQLTPGGGLPAGVDTEVQFNDGGVFGADTPFTYNKTTGVLHVDKFAVDIGDGTQGIVHIDHNGIDKVMYYSVTDDVDGNDVYQPSTWNVSKLSSPTGNFTLDGHLFDTIYSAENLNGSINGVLTGVSSTATLFIPNNNDWGAPNTASFVANESFTRIVNTGNNDSASDFNLISHYFKEPTTTTLGIGNFTGTVQALSAYFEGDIQLQAARRFYFNGSYSEPNLTLGDTYVSFIGVSPNAQLEWTIEGVGSVLRMRSESMLFGGTSVAHCIGGFSSFTMPDYLGVNNTFRNYVFDGGLTVDGPLYASGIFIEGYSNTNSAGAEVVGIVGKGQQNFAFPSIGVRGFATGTSALNMGVQGIAVTSSAGDNYGLYGLAVNGGAGNAYGVYSDGDAFIEGQLFSSIGNAFTYTPTNVTTDRSFDADTVLLAELADVVGTLIQDLQAIGLIT